MRNIVSLFLAAALAGCASTGLVCTEIGCNGFLTVEVQSALDGLIAVELEDHAGVVTCTFDTATDALPICDEASTTLELTDAGFVLTRALAMGEQLDEVTLRVLEDDAAVLDETFAPAYGEPLYPNGEACDEGGCVSAEETFTL